MIVMKNNTSKSNPKLEGDNIKQYIKTLEGGKDVSETKKILVVIHLLKEKNSIKKICKVFSKLPDYNEAIVKAQIKWLDSSPELLA